MKLIESSVEHNKLVEKISELKERNMYIRNVILTLLKTLEIKYHYFYLDPSKKKLKVF